ncbi:hypothetical protein GCM10009761_18780 [Agromyces terreus]
MRPVEASVAVLVAASVEASGMLAAPVVRAARTAVVSVAITGLSSGRGSSRLLTPAGRLNPSPTRAVTACNIRQHGAARRFVEIGHREPVRRTYDVNTARTVGARPANLTRWRIRAARSSADRDRSSTDRPGRRGTLRTHPTRPRSTPPT